MHIFSGQKFIHDLVQKKNIMIRQHNFKCLIKCSLYMACLILFPKKSISYSTLHRMTTQRSSKAPLFLMVNVKVNARLYNKSSRYHVILSPPHHFLPPCNTIISFLSHCIPSPSRRIVQMLEPQTSLRQPPSPTWPRFSASCNAHSD